MKIIVASLPLWSLLDNVIFVYLWIINMFLLVVIPFFFFRHMTVLIWHSLIMEPGAPVLRLLWVQKPPQAPEQSGLSGRVVACSQWQLCVLDYMCQDGPADMTGWVTHSLAPVGRSWPRAALLTIFLYRGEQPWHVKPLNQNREKYM